MTDPDDALVGCCLGCGCLMLVAALLAAGAFLGQWLL